ncbi:MAG: PQQ-binding-like beta-propeller repeat protein, partial [Halobacteriaceae archaeon]
RRDRRPAGSGVAGRATDDGNDYSPASRFAPTVETQLIIWSIRDRIVVLDKNTGEKHWHKDTSGRIQASAIIDDKIVVTIKRTEPGFMEPLIRGRLLSLALADGTELWRKDLDGAAEHGPVIGDDSTFVSYSGGSANPSDYGLVAIDSTKGTEQWHKDVHGGCPAYADGILIQGRGSELVAIHSTEGNIRWDTKIDIEYLYQNLVVMGGESIFVRGTDGISAVDRESGSVTNPNVVMSYNGRLSTYPVVTTNSFAFGTTEGNLYVYDCEESDSVFCLNCGADLTEYETPSFCPSCGESV